MWELLKKLEDLWWKPYWKSIAELTETEKNVRLLTSLSSWLWQFVCENGMIETKWNNWLLNNDDITETADRNIRDRDYQYRLIESSLKDESELEDFLLNNIKVDVESK